MSRFVYLIFAKLSLKSKMIVVWKKTIANAINRKISSLHKRIESMNNVDLCNVSEMNSTIIKCIENCNYTSSDFLNYNSTILNAICKHIKVAANHVNRTKVYRKCKKTLRCVFV